MPRVALLLSTMIWGATFPAAKAVLDQVPPLSFLFLRFLLGTLAVVGVFAVLGRRLRFDRDMLCISMIAAVWLFLGYLLQTIGLRYTTASNSAFITALYVVFVPLFLRRRGWRVWLSAAWATIGLWFLVRPTFTANQGDVLTVGCAAAFAAHIACVERFTRVGDSASFFMWQLLFVTAAMLPAMLWEAPTLAVLAPSGVLLVGLLVTGLLATGAFAVQIWAQRFLPAQQVALLFALEPLCAAWLAWHFLDEHLDAAGWLGSGMILGAVLLGSMDPKVAKVIEPPGAAIREGVRQRERVR